MSKYSLLCVHDEDEEAIVCSRKEEVNPETGRLEPYGEKFEVPDNLGPGSNRLMVETNRRLRADTWGNEASLHEESEPKRQFPLISYNPEDEGAKFGTGVPTMTMTMAVHDLMEVDKVKEDFIDFLKENKVQVQYEPGMEDMWGYEKCGGKPRKIAIDPEGPYLQKTLIHEWGHCKEAIERERKDLEPLYKGETGDWIKEDDKLVPLGHEERAVKFTNRMKKCLNKADGPEEVESCVVELGEVGS